MTSLLMIFGCIACALGFARYNKSNKLFWILLVSLLGGFTGCKMVSSAFAHIELTVHKRSCKRKILSMY